MTRRSHITWWYMVARQECVAALVMLMVALVLVDGSVSRSASSGSSTCVGVQVISDDGGSVSGDTVCGSSASSTSSTAGASSGSSDGGGGKHKEPGGVLSAPPGGTILDPGVTGSGALRPAAPAEVVPEELLKACRQHRILSFFFWKCRRLERLQRLQLQEMAGISLEKEFDQSRQTALSGRLSALVRSMMRGIRRSLHF